MNRGSVSTKPKQDNLLKKKAPKYPLNKISAPNTKENRNIRSAHSAGKNSPTKYPFAGNSTSQDLIHNAIHEYLLNRDLQNTLECFREEINTVQPRRPIEPSLELQILDAYDKGNRELFFQKWGKLIPATMRYKDEFCSKLEFYLHIYFVVFAIHPFTKKPSNKLKQEFDKVEVTHFKSYLDSKGSELAQTSEFLQYYALPYVPNPLDHASFKHIFTKEWLIELRNKLETFIPTVIPNDQSLLMFQMYQAYVRNLNGGDLGGANSGEYAKIIAQLESSNQDLMNILQEYNDKYGNLMKNYHAIQKNEEIARNHLFESHTKWMAFLKELLGSTNELVKMVEGQKQGNQVPDKSLDNIKKKIQRYESFMNSNLDDLLGQSQDNSVFEKFSTSQDIGTPDHSSISNVNRQRMEEKTHQSVATQQQYHVLNFEKIKDFLYNENKNETVLCALLQALRWRITRTRGANLRREIIISYSKHDILDMKRNSPCVLDRITKHPLKRVSEFAARFVNALASDYSGRSYLLESDKLVLMFIQILKQEKGDSIVRRNSLGALQKLSLRKRPQLIMIEQDMIKWIINTLKNEKETLGEYSYEYATALFMNLSLRSLGKKKCEDPNLEVLKVFNDLLEHENMQVRTFVNGTLYSLLSRPVFKEQAKAMGMDEILSYLMENSDERYRKQIQYIFEQLNSDKIEDDAQSDGNDEDNDYDDMEDDDEIGEDEDMEDNIDDPNIPIGEELLAGSFSLSGAEALRQTSMIQEALEESKSVRESTIKDIRQTSNGPLNRPTTPTMLNKIIQQEQVPNIPPELQSRPKILRTPAHVDQENFKRMIQQQYQQMFDVTNDQHEHEGEAEGEGEGEGEEGGQTEGSPEKIVPETKTSNLMNENRQSFNEFAQMKPAQQSFKSDKEIQKEQKLQTQTNNVEYFEAFQSKRQLLRTPPTGTDPRRNF